MLLYYGLLLFFVLEYVRPTSYVPALSALHLNSIVPLGVLLGSILFTKDVKISQILESSNARWIMFLLFLFIVSGLTCDVKIYVLNTFIMVLGYFFMYLTVRKEIYDFDRIKGVLKTLVLVHCIVGALTPEMFSGDGQRHYIASGSFLGDGNDFALSVNIVIPFCLFLMLESKTVTKRLMYSGVLVILVLAVLLTQSRGGVLALACVGLYLWAKSDRKILGAIGMVVILLVALPFAPVELSQRMEHLTGDKQLDGSAQGRLVAWGAAIRMAADNPLLGVGVGHFPVKFGVEYRPEGFGADEMPWLTAHSSYFLILGELGIPGITFLLVIIIRNLIAGERMLRQINRSGKESNIVLRRLVISLNASLVAFAVGGAFLSAVYYPHIFLLAALLECGNLVCTRMSESQSNEIPSGAVPLKYDYAAI